MIHQQFLFAVFRLHLAHVWRAGCLARVLGTRMAGKCLRFMDKIPVAGAMVVSWGIMSCWLCLEANSFEFFHGLSPKTLHTYSPMDSRLFNFIVAGPCRFPRQQSACCWTCRHLDRQSLVVAIIATLSLQS